MKKTTVLLMIILSSVSYSQYGVSWEVNSGTSYISISISNFYISK